MEATLAGSTRTKLSIMMFLQYAFQGIWVIPMWTFLTKGSGYTGQEAGMVLSAIAIGFIVAPFFVGMIADRFFNAERVLAVCNLVAAGLLYYAAVNVVDSAGVKQPMVMFWILLAHCIFYTPTWALTNSIALNQMTDPGKQFPSIRVMGTIGWVAVSTISLFSDDVTEIFGAVGNYEATNIPMLIGAGIGVVAGLLSFIMPKTPPKGKGEKATIGDILGVKALVLFKDRNFLIFAFTSFAIMLPGMFYWGCGNTFLNEAGMEAPQFKQSIGQMTETLFLIAMPWFFLRVGVKHMLMVGIVAWLARFACFQIGADGSMEWLLIAGIALHGICFDFFFVTGQLYTDKKAPIEVRAAAQGLIAMITFGAGWFVAANLTGYVTEKYAIKEMVDGVEKVVGHNWDKIMVWPIAMAAVVGIVFMLGFNDKVKVMHDDESLGDDLAAGAAETAPSVPEGEVQV